MDSEHELLEDIIQKFTHDICKDVEYKYLRPRIVPIFPLLMLQKAEAGGKASYFIMVEICDNVCRLSKDDILRFFKVLKEDHEHVFNEINDEFRRRSGRNLFGGDEETSSLPEPMKPPHNLVPQVPIAVSAHKPVIIGQPFYNPVPETPEPTHTYISIGPAQPCQSYQEEIKDSRRLAGDATANLQSESYSPTSSQSLSSISSSGSQPLPAGIDTQHQQEEQLLQANPSHQEPEAVPVKKYHRKIQEDPNAVYKMDTNPRGFCVIINNMNFQHFSPRNGTNADLENLQKMFTFLGFEVITYMDKTAMEMKDILKEHANSHDLGNVSALAVAILSHGHKNDVIFGIDGALEKDVPVNGTFITKFQLQEIFKGRECQAMIEKPKLFIIQACRGEVEDTDKPGHNGHGATVTSGHDGYVADGPNEEIVYEGEPSRRADTADMVFLHSSSIGYKAYRRKSSGSPFVKQLVDKVKEHAHDESLETMFRKVQSYFSETKIGSLNMTMPEFSSYLTKKWYLNPPELWQHASSHICS